MATTGYQNNTNKYLKVNNDNKFIESIIIYSDDGRFITNITDSMNNITTINNNQINGLTNSITNAKNITTSYSYNNYQY